MARLGTLRVSDVLDYERDIKGKRLIRLRAGVGAGKNYWARHLSEKLPDLQILLITSRKNVAEAEAIHLDIDTKIHTSQLIDIKDRDWYTDYSGNLFVCTNAYIEYFFENIFDIMKSQTHLWDKFDLIIVDEVHALTADASFANSPFYVERFIHHALRLNHRCDVLVMSGTPDPTDWLFTDGYWGTEYTSLDLYDRCIHLVPDVVTLISKAAVAERIRILLSYGRRIIYFANSVKNMADLVNALQLEGIPISDMGIAFSSSDNAQLLPQALLDSKEAIRKHLVSHSSIPSDVKIFITTSQNKEGISIEDDDIKHMFSESHNKADLEQMAGRVRGNPINGTGLHTLYVIYDASEHPYNFTFLDQEFDSLLVDQVKDVLSKHEEMIKSVGKPYHFSQDIKAVHKSHPFIRYDYIGRCFEFYEARKHCEKLEKEDRSDFRSFVDLLDEILHYEIRDGILVGVTGASMLIETWFPYSTLYLAHGPSSTPLKKASTELFTYLEENDYFDSPLDKTTQDKVKEQVLILIQKFGKKPLGFKKSPTTLGPALKHFGLALEAVSSHSSTDKIIRRKTISMGLSQ